MSKKTAKKGRAPRRNTGVKRRSDGRFAAGNTVGMETRFQPGGPGGPGRPPNIGSPRAMLRFYAEQIAPEKLRKEIQRHHPNLDVKSLTWSEVVALAHLSRAATGDMAAISAIYKQLDDGGASIGAGSLDLTGMDGIPRVPLEAARAIAARFDETQAKRKQGRS